MQPLVRHRLTAVLWMLLIALLPVLIRLAILPWRPAPVPFIADEFVHILVADTLASGRLANPPHPMARHLESIYILHSPTYAGVYPPGLGLIMAAGKVLFGSFFAGVLLAVGLMCGAITWALLGCLPRRWAVAGGLLSAFYFGLSAWNDCYWGGAFCAFGGALFFGALRRLQVSPSGALGLIGGAGWGVMWLLRPYESAFSCLLAWAFLALLLVRDWKQSRVWRQTAARWVAALTLFLGAQILAGIVTAAHNHAVTGSYTTLPYQLGRDLNGVPQTALWTTPIPPPKAGFKTPEQEATYQWTLAGKLRMEQQPWRRFGAVVFYSWQYYISVWFSIPFFLVALKWRDPDVRLAAGILFCGVVVSSLQAFFFRHYISGYTCLFVFLIVRGMMALSAWAPRAKPLGRLAAGLMLAGGIGSSLSFIPFGRILGMDPKTPESRVRDLVLDRVAAQAGAHLIYVRYSKTHSVYDEWVYNGANIDAGRVVWCRAMGADDDREIAQYYADRQKWIVDVEESSARLSRYDPARPPASVSPAESFATATKESGSVFKTILRLQ